MRMIQKLGPLREVFAKLPFFGAAAEQVDEGEIGRVEALIHSMTPGERARPDIIDKSRASRIARGSGRRSREVFELVERFGQMRQMMASLGSGGLLSRIPGLGRLAGAGGGGVDPAALLAGAPGFGGAAGSARGLRRNRVKQKGKRKQARQARRKNRRR
jgi:signal recognition particle subunit SRP54